MTLRIYKFMTDIEFDVVIWNEMQMAKLYTTIKSLILSHFP